MRKKPVPWIVRVHHKRCRVTTCTRSEVRAAAKKLLSYRDRLPAGAVIDREKVEVLP